uniref:Uncharacterized protein n=1 Tax=Saimiri boliviensis boliviensis TaxID=39432 RepID=A0A2K6UCY7_SAIBB
MVRIGTTVMIVLILLRIARQAPAQAQSSDPVRRLFLLGLGAPGVGTWSSPEIAEPPSPAGIRAQDRAPRHRRAPPARMPVAPAPSADGGERRRGRRTGVGGWGPTDPVLISDKIPTDPRRDRHLGAPRRPERSTSAPLPQSRCGNAKAAFPLHRQRPHWLELNTWMKVERLLVEKLHQSFSLDH